MSVPISSPLHCSIIHPNTYTTNNVIHCHIHRYTHSRVSIGTHVLYLCMRYTQTWYWHYSRQMTVVRPLKAVLAVVYKYIGNFNSGGLQSGVVGGGLQIGLQSGESSVGSGLQIHVACKSGEEVNQQIFKEQDQNNNYYIEDLDDIPLKYVIFIICRFTLFYCSPTQLFFCSPYYPILLFFCSPSSPTELFYCSSNYPIWTFYRSTSSTYCSPYYPFYRSTSSPTELFYCSPSSSSELLYCSRYCSTQFQNY